MTAQSTAGISSAVGEFISVLKSRGVHLHALALSIGGEQREERYFDPITVDSPLRMYSVGKSLVSLAIGVLIGEGVVSLDAEVCDFFPEYASIARHPYVQKMRLVDLLSMRSPHSSTTYNRWKNDDWLESFFGVEPENPPGSFFAYDTSASHVLGAIVSRLSGMDLMEFIVDRFWRTIGNSPEAFFLADPRGIAQGGSGLVCTMMDIHRIAQLCLNMGAYRGQQLIPHHFVERATTFQVSTAHMGPPDERWGYGYQIWMARDRGYVLYGLGGQLSFVIPDLDVVCTTAAYTRDSPTGTADLHRAFWDILIPAIEASSSELYLQRRDARLRSYAAVSQFSITQTMSWLGSIGGKYESHAWKEMPLEGDLSICPGDKQVVLKGRMRGAYHPFELAFGYEEQHAATIWNQDSGIWLPCFGLVRPVGRSECSFELRVHGELPARLEILLSRAVPELSLRMLHSGEPGFWTEI